MRTCIGLFLFALCAPVYPAHAEADSSIEVLGYVQNLYSFEERGESSADVIRMRFGLAGKAGEKWSYFMISECGDYSPFGPFRFALIDALITYHYSPWLNVTFGQDFYKLGIEGSTLSSRLPFIFRSRVVFDLWDTMGRNGFYAEDVGLWIDGQVGENRIPVQYFLSVTNGTGLGNSEDNKRKDVSYRVVVEPVHGLRVGSSGFNGYSRVDEKDFRDWILGGEVSLEYRHIRTSAEYLYAKYGGGDGASGPVPLVEKFGWYWMCSYAVVPSVAVLFRLEYFDPDVHVDEDGFTGITVGTNVQITDKIELKVNAVREDDSKDLSNGLYGQLQANF